MVMCVMVLASSSVMADSQTISRPQERKAKISSTWGKNARDIRYFYTDEYFSKLASTEFNEHLASCSLAMAISAGNNSSKWVLGALEDIGCQDTRSYEYGDENTYKSVGFALGRRVLADGTILVPVIMRGSNYTLEWGMNFLAGLKGNALGYNWPANKVYSVVREYVGKEDNVKIWICGYSRGGAVGNLLAKKLSYYYGKDKVYAYCFDAPKASDHPDSQYTNIHNVQNKYDGITCVLPEYMGFGRNGNESIMLGGVDKEAAMKTYLKEYTGTNYINKYQSPYDMEWSRLVINLDFSSVDALLKSVKGLANGGKFYEFKASEDECNPELIWSALIDELEKVVPTRRAYVKSGMQSGLSNLAVLYKSLSPEQTNALKESIKDKKTLLKLASNLNLVEALINVQRGKMTSLTGAEYKCIATTIYSALIDNNTFTKEQKVLAYQAIRKLIKPFLKLLALDYRSGHQMLGTIIQNNNLDRLSQCHYYDINMAYMMSVDSFYAEK